MKILPKIENCSDIGKKYFEIISDMASEVADVEADDQYGYEVRNLIKR